MTPDTPPKNLPASAHITGASLLSPTIQAWSIYLTDQGVSNHTLKAFTSDLNLFAAYAPADRTLGEVSTVELTHFLEWLQNGRGVPCSPKTLARRITSLKAFFRWLLQYGVILADPAEKIPQRTVISPLPEVLAPEEAEAVLAAAEAHRRAARPDARPYALLALLLQTGVKKGETLAISPNHVVEDAPEGPFLFVRYASPANRYKERKIALSEGWLEAYHEYAGQYELGDRLFPWSPRRLEYLLEDLGVEAGLTKHLSFDMCRWSCALDDLRSGQDRDAIRQKLGISKVQWREIGMKLDKLLSGTEQAA
ncbi:MAG: tyrosine-type recombinase/integrase [Chloroflexota bacterium]